MYTAIVLDSESQQQLRKLANDLYSESVDLYDTWHCHHCTVNLGEKAQGPAKGFPLNSLFDMIVTHIGIVPGAVIAAKVIGIQRALPSVNRHTHVTIMTNASRGGKPRMSNDIDDWAPSLIRLYLKGTLQECE